MPARRPTAELHKAERAVRIAIKKYLRKAHPAPAQASRIVSPHPGHNVVGVGIGKKKVRNKDVNILCVRLFVRHKFSPSASKKFALPETIQGVPTDIIAVGTPRRSAPGDVIDSERIRPARPGCWIAPEPETEISFDMRGTFGAVIEDEEGKLYILSNNHVLASEDANAPGTVIYQPTSDSARNKIATLATVVALRRPGGNKVDCALARVLDNSHVSGVPLENMGPLSSDQTIEPEPEMTVEKVGAATGHTTGTIGSVGATFRIDEYMTGPILLEDQIQIEDGDHPFCDHGDSGSLVVDAATKQATGLLAVNMDGFALANRLSNVLTALSATLGLSLRLKIS